MPKLRMRKVVGVQNIVLKGCDNLDNGSWFQNLVSWVINKQRRNMNKTWWNYSIEELEQMADENGKITKESMEKFNKEMTEDNEQEHLY